MTPSRIRRRNLVSRACDRCKSRKSKCSGSQPCQQCVAAVAECSYLTVQRMRGPPKSRLSNSRISSRKVPDNRPAQRPELTGGEPRAPAPRFRPRIAVSALSPILALYQASMFSVWPIVDTDNLISRLNDRSGLYDYALALATAAATMGQLKAALNLPGQCPSAELCEAECQRVHYALQSRNDSPNLTRLRAAFFLHAYHENRERGSVKSFLYLREAISLAQLMDLHDETSYEHIPADQARLRKRIFWLLFITERGNSVFHHLPVLLAPTLQPLLNDTIPEARLFEPLETVAQIFTAIDRSGLCRSTSSSNQAALQGLPQLNAFDSTLRRVFSVLGNTDDTHKADIFVTVCWARILLWKAAQPAMINPSDLSRCLSLPLYLVNVVEEMISSLEQLPLTAIEAHGLGIQVKIFDMASTLIEYAADLSYANDSSGMPPEQRCLAALRKLHNILASIKSALLLRRGQLEPDLGQRQQQYVYWCRYTRPLIG
ncbi:hypothetical protein B0J13DRAFT_570872 [Dactylonectria estremocensis]|uniref:Zn(2)-C6 fungal-type domain-containing protein n=1 Tax=Dactylonectria estremocensis TaxID=1079267 RepID=A0A9P9IF80_9HYPO|nr:hypothetical protein B0J13DRAFT_570872 [Dactylonectria estremocensis]